MERARADVERLWRNEIKKRLDVIDVGMRSLRTGTSFVRVFAPFASDVDENPLQP